MSAPRLALVLVLALVASCQAGVYISELFANSVPPEVDWLELYNNGSAPVNLNGYWLSDAKASGNRTKSRLGNLVVPANGYVVLTQGVDWTGFGFSGSGDCVTLSDASSTTAPALVDSDCYDGMPAGKTMGLFINSQGALKHPLLQWPTKGAANAYPAVGPLVITGISYFPAAGGEEFVRITNIGSTSLSTSYTWPANSSATTTWGLEAFRFPAMTIAAGETFYVTPASAATLRTKLGLASNVQVIENFIKNGTGINVFNNVTERLTINKPGEYLNTTNTWIYYPADYVRYDASWVPATAGQGAFLARKCNKAFGDEPKNWISSALTGCVAANCGSVDSCTSSVCDTAKTGCSCTLDTTTQPVCSPAPPPPTPSPSPIPSPSFPTPNPKILLASEFLSVPFLLLAVAALLN